MACGVQSDRTGRNLFLLFVLIVGKIQNKMSTQFLIEQWSIIRDKLQEKYPNLTDNDLAYVHGSETEVFDRVERRTGLKRQEIEQSLLKELNVTA